MRETARAEVTLLQNFLGETELGLLNGTQLLSNAAVNYTLLNTSGKTASLAAIPGPVAYIGALRPRIRPTRYSTAQ